MLKQGKARDLFRGKGQNLVELEIYFIKEMLKEGTAGLKILNQGTAGDLCYCKGQDKVRLGFVLLKIPK